MFRANKRIATTTAVFAAMLATAAPSFAAKLGSNLLDAPNAGLCPTAPPAVEATCTETQLQLSGGHDASGGLLAEHRGVITRWTVLSGPASPATAGVQMRLRLLRGGKSVAGAVTPYVALPLTEPGLHRFPARLPIGPDGELGLDLAVLGSGGGVGLAPIAHTEPFLGEVGEWVPPLTSAAEPVTNYLHDTELLLGARIEPDKDRDGYGDVSQDRCAYDPRRQSPCLPDHVRPRVEVGYERRQIFLATHLVRLMVKSSEFSQVIVNGQLELPTATWGINGASAWVRREGGSAKLVLRIPPRPVKAAEAALEHGGRAYIKAFITVIDASGNRIHKTIRVLPKSR
jgi:hypothetical protein